MILLYIISKIENIILSIGFFLKEQQRHKSKKNRIQYKQINFHKIHIFFNYLHENDFFLLYYYIYYNYH